MNIDNLIPGVATAKMAIAGIGLLALGIIGYKIYDHFHMLGVRAEAAEKALEQQKQETAKAVDRMDRAVEIANENTKLLAQYKADKDASDARSEEFRRQRDLFWRQTNELISSLKDKPDGPLADGVLFGLSGLCRQIVASGGTCSAFDRKNGQVNIPGQPGEPKVQPVR